MVCLGGHGRAERLPAHLFASVTGSACPSFLGHIDGKGSSRQDHHSKDWVKTASPLPHPPPPQKITAFLISCLSWQSGVWSPHSFHSKWAQVNGARQTMKHGLSYRLFGIVRWEGGGSLQAIEVTASFGKCRHCNLAVLAAVEWIPVGYCSSLSSY